MAAVRRKNSVREIPAVGEPPATLIGPAIVREDGS
jgi:hypothetical protein